VAAAADEAQKEVKDGCQGHIAVGLLAVGHGANPITIGIPLEYHWTHVDTVDLRIPGYNKGGRPT